MDNMFLLVTVFLALFALVVFLIFKNKKDRRELEEKLNTDYKKPRDEEGDVETDLKQD